MIRNYIKIAWRNLRINRGFSIINIGGLAVGMAVVILIGLWIFDEISYNQNHKNYERIAQVMINKTSGSGTVTTRQTIPYPLGDELRKTHGDQFRHVVMSSFHGANTLSVGDKNLSKHGGFMEPDALEMLSLKMIKGDWDGLKNPNSIVLSQSTAEVFFGEHDPIGEIMKIGNALDVIVRGVYKDLPFNSKFKEVKFIAPWDLYVNSYDWISYARDNVQWDNNSYQLFVQIAEGTKMEQISSNIENTIYKNIPEHSKSSHPEIFLYAMKDWHLRSNWKDGHNIGGFIQYVWLFGIVGLFVLILACINFMNLSTAQSEKRAKEVGIRKSVGSGKVELIKQFLTESFLVVLAAYVLAIVLVLLIIPSFNQLANKEIAFPVSNILFWLISVGFILMTGIFAGSYPALYLSSFQPAKVLKGAFKPGKSTISLRRILVITQFTVSIVLVIGTIVVKKQIEFTKNRAIGYEKNNLVMIEKMTEDYEGLYNQMRNDLINSGAVLDMSESSAPMTEVWSSTGGFEWEGKDPNFIPNIVIVSIGHDYGNTVGWEIVQGRDFSREYATDSTAFVLNETAVKYMGLQDPVNKIIKWSRGEHKIIGVVADILTESPYKSVRPAIYLINYKNTNWINLKLNPNKGTRSSLALIETIFKNHAPNVPFAHQFVDQTFATKFDAEERIGVLAGIFAILAILISCLGLFGLAAFTAERRTKEIGIRKVIGASVFNLWKLLSKDFVMLVMLSCIIAIPLAYYGMTQWLNNYEYQTEIPWWIFLVSGLMAFTITLITVSFQAVKVAIMNPITSLRTE